MIFCLGKPINLTRGFCHFIIQAMVTLTDAIMQDKGDIYLSINDLRLNLLNDEQLSEQAFVEGRHEALDPSWRCVAFHDCQPSPIPSYFASLPMWNSLQRRPNRRNLRLNHKMRQGR